MREYRITRNTMFIFGPRCVMQARSDKRFKARILAFSSEFMRRLTLDTKRILQLFLQLADHPCIELRSAEGESLGDYIRLIDTELQEPELQFSRDIVSELIAATIYKVGDILTHYLTEHPEVDSPIHNRAEEYFRQFTELLGEHYKHERSVGFYARQLCITPKYLTTLIKRISGKSVSEWIDNYVILEAKTLLKYSNMSVQEIAYYLNFPNQSFFGSYFKRNAGMSPSQYKAKK
jgi:AraC family transcriptional activator of pobA